MVLHKRRRMGKDGSTHAAHHFACHLQDEDEKLKIKHEDEDEDEDEDEEEGEEGHREGCDVNGD